MSQDESVTKDLIETLEDGRKGFAQAADKLDGGEHAQASSQLRQFSEQRASFSAELQNMAENYGDDIDESGSMAATAHRGWISLKDALTGDDPDAVLAAVETGEEHAVSEYEDALDKDISANLRQVVERQAGEVRSAHSAVQSLRNS